MQLMKGNFQLVYSLPLKVSIIRMARIFNFKKDIYITTFFKYAISAYRFIKTYTLFLAVLQLICFKTPLKANEKQYILEIVQSLSNCLLLDSNITEISGGLTNKNYQASICHRKYFIRTSYSENCLLGTALENEWTCTSLVAKYEISPKAYFFIPAKKTVDCNINPPSIRSENISQDDLSIMVTEFIATDPIELNLNDPLILAQFIQLIKTLHTLPVTFPRTLLPFKSIENYISSVASVNAFIPNVLKECIIPFIDELKTVHWKDPSTHLLVPCHLDLHRGNILNTVDRLWLIDWEYSAMSDPLFDLATLTSTENFTEEQTKQLLKQYYGADHEVSYETIRYFKVMRILADIRWALWCFLQAKISTLNEPFADYGYHYTKQCLFWINSYLESDEK